MANLVVLLLLIALLVVLGMGIFNLLRGADAAKGNRLMVWRVVIQGLVIVVLVGFLAK